MELILDCWKFFPVEIVEVIIEFLFVIQPDSLNLISCVNLWKLSLVNKKFRNRVKKIIPKSSSFLNELHGKRYILFHQCWFLRMEYIHFKCSQNRKSLHRLLIGGIEKKFPKRYFINLAIPDYIFLERQILPNILPTICRIDELKCVNNKIILRHFNQDQLNFFRGYYYFMNEIQTLLIYCQANTWGRLEYETKLISDLNRTVSNFLVSNFHEYVNYNSAVSI